MNSFKKIITSVLCGTTLLSSAFLMSACKEKGDAKSNAVDLGGRTIKMVSWGKNNGGVYVDPEATSEFGALKAERLAEFEKLYNCKFELELVDAAEIQSKFTAAALSGDSIGDLVCMRGPWVNNVLNKDLILPLDEYFDFSKPQFSKTAKENFTRDGKTYAFSTETTNHVENVIFFNKRIFDDLGLEYPYQLVKDKKWNIDKFTEYLQKATVVKNGETQIYGMYGFYLNGDTLPGFLKSFGAEFAHKTDKGYVSGLSDPQMTTALEYVRSMQLDKKYIYRPSGEANWDEDQTMFVEGKVAMMMNGLWVADGGLKDKMTDDFGVVPVPLAEGETEYSIIQPYENVWVMPASVDSNVAKAIGNILTAVHAPVSEDENEQKETLKNSIKNNYCDSESVDIAYGLMTQDNMEIYNHYTISVSDWRNTVNSQITKVMSGKTTVASAIAAVETVWKNKIEEYNKNNNLG